MRRQGTGLLLALTLAGCSVTGGVVDWMSDDSAGPEPINYRYVVATSLDGIMGARAKRPEGVGAINSAPRRFGQRCGVAGVSEVFAKFVAPAAGLLRRRHPAGKNCGIPHRGRHRRVRSPALHAV